jgi:hypothetical protein
MLPDVEQGIVFLDQNLGEAALKEGFSVEPPD